MSEELRTQLESALTDGAISEQEILDVIARGYVRLKTEIAQRAVEAGITEAEIAEVIAKRK